jgi:hypothetical protein
MPKGFLAAWPLLGHSDVVQGFRDRANGIDGAPHGHLQTLGIRQGEIASAASAVGRRVGSALAGSSPKTTHLSDGFRAPAGVLDWIHAPPQAYQRPEGLNALKGWSSDTSRTLVRGVCVMMTLISSATE